MATTAGRRRAPAPLRVVLPLFLLIFLSARPLLAKATEQGGVEASKESAAAGGAVEGGAADPSSSSPVDVATNADASDQPDLAPGTGGPALGEGVTESQPQGSVDPSPGGDAAREGQPLEVAGDHAQGGGAHDGSDSGGGAEGGGGLVSSPYPLGGLPCDDMVCTCISSGELSLIRMDLGEQCSALELLLPAAPQLAPPSRPPPRSPKPKPVIRQLPDPDEYIQAEREEAKRRGQALLQEGGFLRHKAEGGGGHGHDGEERGGGGGPRAVYGTPREELRLEQDMENMAAKKMGAKVLAANAEATRLSEVLRDDPDTYLKNECNTKDGLWIVIELPQVVKVEAITVSVSEMYSARIKTMTVLSREARLHGDPQEIAATRNGSEWHPLAELIAENRRGTHAFRLPWERWAKYLQIRFESHYGNQKVCAINEIQVFGLTKAEEIMKELEAVGGPPHVPPPLHTDPSVQPPPPLPPEAAPPESGGEDAGGEAPAAEAAGAVDLTAEGQPLQAAAAGKEEPARGRPLPAEEAPREAPTGAEGGGGGSGAAGDDAADTAVAAEPEPSAVSGGSGQPAAVREAPAGPEGAREAADGGDVDGEEAGGAPSDQGDDAGGELPGTGSAGEPAGSGEAEQASDRAGAAGASPEAPRLDQMADYATSGTRGSSAIIDMFLQELKMLKLDSVYNKKYMKDAVSNITFTFMEHEEQVEEVTEQLDAVRESLQVLERSVDSQLGKLAADGKQLSRGLAQSQAEVAALQASLKASQRQQQLLLAAVCAVLALRGGWHHAPVAPNGEAPASRAAAGLWGLLGWTGRAAGCAWAALLALCWSCAGRVALEDIGSCAVKRLLASLR
eukprot:jgi/Tetstr1/436931/TSEL_025704.t1